MTSNRKSGKDSELNVGSELNVVMEQNPSVKKTGLMGVKVKTLLLAVCVVSLFFGCSDEENIKIAGTKWVSLNALKDDIDSRDYKFIYIHFIDKTNFEYCFVDYDLNKLTDVEKASYTRISNSIIAFSGTFCYTYTVSDVNWSCDNFFDNAVFLGKSMTLCFSNRCSDNSLSGNSIDCKRINKKAK